MDDDAWNVTEMEREWFVQDAIMALQNEFGMSYDDAREAVFG